jgi:catechol 2,3-dioxygenase-like lactoylglutathione lyase family enzyme
MFQEYNEFIGFSRFSPSSNYLTANCDCCYIDPMKVRHVDHIGINVENLEAAKAFFVDFGFTVMGEMHMEGELVERVIGLKDVSDDLVMLQAPDGQLNIELVKFHHPVDKAGVQLYSANTLGLRHLCFQVEDLDGIVATLKQKGHKLVGKIQTYENMWKLCYVRGPEGIILELAEQIGK